MRQHRLFAFPWVYILLALEEGRTCRACQVFEAGEVLELDVDGMVIVLEQIDLLLAQQAGVLVPEDLPALFFGVAQLHAFAPEDVVHVLEEMALGHLQLLPPHGHALALAFGLRLALLAPRFPHFFPLRHIYLQV